MFPAFLALPRWAHAAIGLAVAVLAFLAWLHFHDRAVVREYEAAITEEVERKTGQASEAAREAADTTIQDVEKTNAQARDDARNSDDPLRAGLDRLRQEREDRTPTR
jgi:hypothetical protein